MDYNLRLLEGFDKLGLADMRALRDQVQEEIDHAIERIKYAESDAELAHFNELNVVLWMLIELISNRLVELRAACFTIQLPDGRDALEHAPYIKNAPFA